MSIIYHLALAEDWQRAQSESHYECASLSHEGFIHCAYTEQLQGVAKRYFKGRDKLCLLSIDSTQLDCNWREENTVGGTELFPHVYGRISKAAITHIQHCRIAEDGLFEPDLDKLIGTTG